MGGRVSRYHRNSRCCAHAGESGFTPVSLAVTLPLLLLLVFSAIELFLYMRTLGVVSRAAGEAAQVMAAANPQGSFVYTPNDLSADSSTAVTSKSGGLGDLKLDDAFELYGQGYGDFAGATALPFPLARAKSTTVGTGDPGVMYLPMSRVYTCLRPKSESARTMASCSVDDKIHKQSGTLVYQLPTKIDFDGDGAEDLSFFDQNNGLDWWIIPSSSGSFFRYSLSFESAPNPSAEAQYNRPQWLPCPADYDGDGKTDICAAAVDSGKVKVRLRLSTQYYFPNPEIELSSATTIQIAPVPGRWSDSSVDQFAYIVLESTTASGEYNTVIYPAFTASGTSSFTGAVYESTGAATTLSGSKFVPRGGVNVRPAFGDHDGDGILDVGWLEWPGGNLSYRIAGAGDGITSESDVDALTVEMRPWGIHYSASGVIFVVERENHRVSAILAEGTATTPTYRYRRIMGEESLKIDSSLLSPNPSYLDPFDASAVPINDGDNGCSSCPAGGGFSSSPKKANVAALNTPTDVVDTAVPGKPLFVADYGNYRVQRLDPEATSYVKAGIESVATEVGGAAAVDCKSLYGAGPSIGEASVPWSSYDAATQAAGIHPSCVNVRPLSVELTTGASQNWLLVGDARGAIFAVDPAADGIFNADTDKNEKIYLIAGIYGKLSKSGPTTGASPTATILGEPVDMEMAMIGGTPVLHVVIQNSGLPAAGMTSTGPANTGGIIRISAGADHLFGTGDDAMLSNWGDFVQQDLRPRSADTAHNPTFSIRNPTAIAMPATLSNIDDGIFVSSWWNNQGSEPYENALLRLVRASTSASSDTIVRWFNSEHAHGWGMVPPNEPTTSYATLEWSTALPLATLPVLPGSGVGLSSTGDKLVFAEPTRGQVMLTILDHDGDGTLDISDNDVDGDGIADASETQLGMFSATTEFYPELLDDPVMWATGSTVKIHGCTAASCTQLKRISWWIDRLSMRAEVPGKTAALPLEEEGMFMLFNDQTVAAPNGRGAIVNGAIYEGGPDRGTETNPDTGTPLLAPLVMGSPTPSEDQLKSVKGYDHCAWGLKLFDSAMNTDGEPVTSCDIDNSSSLGIRRVHLAQWTNQWHPWGAETPEESAPGNDIIFLDWDGDGVRNPVVIKNDIISSSSKQPLLAHIGNITGTTTCPGSFGSTGVPAEDTLAETLPVLETKLALSLSEDSTPQFACDDSLTAFSSGSTHTASVMVDTHAEWKVYNEQAEESHSKTTSDRLSLGSKGDLDISGQIGPVAETAYQVLERSLKVSSRENDTDPNGAKVSFSEPTAEGLVTVTVEYVYPFNTFVRSILGMKTQTMTAQVTRRMYK